MGFNAHKLLDAFYSRMLEYRQREVNKKCALKEV